MSYYRKKPVAKRGRIVSRAKQKPVEIAVPVTPSDLRTMLTFVGLRDYRADRAVRLLAYLGTLPRGGENG